MCPSLLGISTDTAGVRFRSYALFTPPVLSAQDLWLRHAYCLQKTDVSNTCTSVGAAGGASGVGAGADGAWTCVGGGTEFMSDSRNPIPTIATNPSTTHVTRLVLCAGAPIGLAGLLVVPLS